MDNRYSSEGRHLLQARKRHQRWIVLVICLGILISAGTFFTLKYNAVAKTYQKQVLDCHAVSGAVSHVHNDDCYYNGELVCPLQEIEPHQHSDACYREDPVLICGLEETAGHQHTDACYQPVYELACGLEETNGDETHPAHHHTVDCYRPVMELICGLEETPGDENHPAHWHTDACYQEVKQLVCGMEEGQGAHYHSDACWGTQQVLICGLEELPVHVHGPECFRTEEMTEEEIAAMQLAEAASASENTENTGADNTTPDETQESGSLSEDGQTSPEDQTQPADEAESETTENIETPDDIENADAEPAAEGETETGDETASPEEEAIDYPMQTEPFHFASMAGDILVTVDAPAEAFPAGTEMKVRAVYDEQILSDAAGAVDGNVVQVQAVDISFWFGGKEIEPMQPIRVVMTPVETPEFDAQTVVHVDDAGETAVIEQEDVEVPEASFEVDTFSVYCLVYTKIEATILASDGNNYKITVTAPDDAPFPQNAKLWATEIEAGANAYGVTYNEYLTKTEYALGWEAGSATYLRLFDIFVGDEFGNKLTLTTPVDVKIELLDKEADKESSVVHFGAKTEVMPAETAGQTVSFEASSFSVYAVAENTITQYVLASDGQNYKVSLTYGPDAGIPDGAELEVSEVLSGEATEGMSYEDYAAKAERSLDENVRLTFARFFDITIVANGEAIQPLAPVEVKIELAEAQDQASEDVKALHFYDDGGIRTIPTNVEEQTVSFNADGFSVYGIIGTETLTADYITAEGETYTITVTYDQTAEIPEGATLEVTEIVNGDKDYTDYVEQAARALTEGEELPFVNAARLFDISIMADGKKVEPKAPVEVKIEYASAQNLNETSEVGTVHFKESLLKTETEVMDIIVQGEEGKVDGVTFTTDAFSIYAVVIIDKEAGTFVFEDESYKVTVRYTKEANIPIGTELTVREINSEEDQYWDLRKQLIDKINEGVERTNFDQPDPRKGITDAVFFDVALNYEGKEIEPDVPLEVKIEYKTSGIVVPEGESTGVVHFGKEETEIIENIETEVINIEAENAGLVTSYKYEQSGFSPVGNYSTGEYIEITVIDNTSVRALAAPPVRASSIKASKDITDEDGDGIYELALSVTGQSESSSQTNVDKSNVVIVIDVSGSMDEEVYSEYSYSASTYDSNTTYYGYRNNNYIQVWRYGNNWYRTRQWKNGGWQYSNQYNGTVYTQSTRLESTQAAACALVDALLANNKDQTQDGVSLRDIIEISLVKFANNTATYQYNGTETLVSKSTDAAVLKNAINALTAGGGTNWEMALQQAKTEADTYRNQTGETTSVIFLTDGKPTFQGSNDQGTGQEGNDNVQTCWDAAKDDARTIVTSGYNLYNIFAFGTDSGTNSGSNYLKALTNYAYTGTGTYSSYGDQTYTDGTSTSDYFYNATSTQALIDAFQKIIDKINKAVGYGGVEYDDGVTLGVTNTSVSVDGTVHEGSFRYTVRDSSGTIVYTVKIANGSATFSIPGKGDHTDNSPETVTTKIDENDQSTWIESQVYSVEVDGVTYMMSPASINTDNGMVEWDLAGLGILQNGYTYTVAFDVWPNQFSYDLVADLNNGVKTLPQIKQELIDEHGEEAGTALYNQIVQALIGPDANNQYAIRTNYEQKVDYYTVSQEEDSEGNITTTYSEKQTKDVDFDDEIALTSKPLPMVKVWNSNLSPDQIGNLLYSDYPTNSVPTQYRVTLHLWKADTAAELQNLIDQYAGNPTTASANDYIEKTLGWNGTAYDWEDSVSIAPGTMVSLQTAIDMGIDTTSPEHQKNIVTYDGAQYYIIETGHYYYVTEDNIDWHFELETVIYHPMMVNGRLKNVTFITDDDGNITGVEDIEDMTQVTATNSKTAELDITKKVVDNTGKMTQAQMDAETFTYKVTLTVPVDADMSHTNALEWVARYNDDASASNRYYVYGYQTSEDAELLGLSDDVERFNGKVYGQYTVSYPGGGATLDEIFTNDPGGTTKSGTIYITLLQNEIIRLTNLPSGTQYRIEEIYNNLYQANPSRDADANLGNNAPESNVEANGYTVSIITKNGSATPSGRVVTGTINELNKRYYNQFTNTLNNTAVVSLDVTKHLQGYEWNGDRYYVKLAAADENTPLPRITTRYLSAASGTDDVTFNFGNVHLKPGTYTYTITETASDYAEVYSGKVVNGVTYDAVKTIIVTVANDLSISIAEGSSDGVTYDSTTNTVKTKVTNKVLPLSIYKIGETNTENGLEGVEFKLYSDSALTTQVTQDSRGNAIGTNGLITTGEDGTAKIGVLNTGTYYLVETGLGDNGGYNMLTDAVEITIGDTIHYKQTAYSKSEMYNSASSKTDLVKSKGGMYINYAEDGTTIAGYTFTINNSTGYELPQTGGRGTLLYTLSGLVLMLGAAMVYVTLRRRETD